MELKTKDSNQLLEEYKFLREEILYFMDKDTTLLTCLFSCVTATLFFSLEMNVPEGCILAFLIILPICNKLAYHQKQVAKIAVYIQQFLEPYLDIKWESFLKDLSIHNDRPKTGRYLKFSECPMVAIMAALSYVYLAIKGELWKQNQFIFIVEIVLIVLFLLITLHMSSKIYGMKDYRIEYTKRVDKLYSDPSAH